jgi:hypothetical protein
VASTQDENEWASARERWLAALYAATPADRSAAEQGVCDMYSAANMEPPRYLVWLNSPSECCWAALLLNARRDQLMRRIAEALEKNRQVREQLQLVRIEAAKYAGVAGWEKIAADAGGPLIGMGADVHRSFQLPMMKARLALWDDPGSAMGNLVHDRLYAEQTGLYKLFGRSLQGGVESLVGSAVSQAYNFYWMARDEQKTANGTAPPFLEAAWRVARAAGPWWAYDGLALLSERPSEMHRNPYGLPERGDGPAILYRNGPRIYAWNGKAYPEKWIEQPEMIPPSQLKQADKSFQEYLSRRLGSAPPAKAVKPAKPSALLKAKLPADAAERIEYLRKHTGGKLPLYDRYLAGEHTEVWRELLAQGAAVRSDPLLADALAVAYETMRRVDANVRTLVGRLLAIGYRFKTEADAWQERESAIGAALAFSPQPHEISLRSPHVRDVLQRLEEARTQVLGVLETARSAPHDDGIHPHEPPPANTAKLLARLEKKVGALPLSLRAFYEVVGSVDFIGSHPSLAPLRSASCPDPLVIFALEDVLAYLDSIDGDDDDHRVMLAPDDIHKAGESGGEPYEMAAPDPRADGEMLNERHELRFVEYLRLVFRFGGFPGYEGHDLPPEIEQLRAELLEF